MSGTCSPDIPVILCTGYSDLVDRERALALGVDDFLLKPVERLELSRCVEQVLKKSGGSGA